MVASEREIWFCKAVLRRERPGRLNWKVPRGTAESARHCGRLVPMDGANSFYVNNDEREQGFFAIIVTGVGLPGFSGVRQVRKKATFVSRRSPTRFPTTITLCLLQNEF